MCFSTLNEQKRNIYKNAAFQKTTNYLQHNNIGSHHNNISQENKNISPKHNNMCGNAAFQVAPTEVLQTTRGTCTLLYLSWRFANAVVFWADVVVVWTNAVVLLLNVVML